MLAHWGNTNAKYTTSTTAYPWDNWDPIPLDWRGDHPCYDPAKDLVLPAWKFPDPYPVLQNFSSRYTAGFHTSASTGRIPFPKKNGGFAENILHPYMNLCQVTNYLLKCTTLKLEHLMQTSSRSANFILLQRQLGECVRKWPARNWVCLLHII